MSARITRFTAPVGAFGMLAILAGCASNTACGDPRYDGFGTAVSGNLSGCYQRRVDALAVQSADREARVASLRRQNAALEAERARLTAEEQRIAERIRSASAEIERASAQLEALRRQGRVNQAEHDLLDNQLRDLERQRTTLGVPEASDPALEAEVQSLEEGNARLRKILEDY